MAEQATTLSVPVRQVPALSATSDVPKVDAQVVDPAATGDAGKADAGKTADPNAAAPVVADAAPDLSKIDWSKIKFEDYPPVVKSEVTKARNQRNAEKQRADQLQAERDAEKERVNKALDAFERLSQAQRTSDKDADPRPVRPKRESFDTPTAYDDALAAHGDALVEWATRQGAKATAAELEAKAKTEREKADKDAAAKVTQENNQRVYDAWMAKRAAFVEKHPDYAEVAESPDIIITNEMSITLMQDDDGPAIAYYLGQNPDEAERISKLSPVRQASELGRIAARLNAPQPVKTKPDPITPLNTGSGAAIRKGPNEESMDEYGNRRLAELRAQRGGNGAAITH